VSFTFVQSHAFGTQTATTTTYAFPSNVTSGDLLVWSGHYTSASSRTISSISDTLGNTWVVGATGVSGSQGAPAAYCLKSVGSGANTLSIPWNASVTIQDAWLGEFTAPSGTTFDGSNSQTVTQQPCGNCDFFSDGSTAAGDLSIGFNTCLSNCDNPYIAGATATWTAANTAASNCFYYTLATDAVGYANVDARAECGCFAYDYIFTFLAFSPPASGGPNPAAIWPDQGNQRGNHNQGFSTSQWIPESLDQPNPPTIFSDRGYGTPNRPDVPQWNQWIPESLDQPNPPTIFSDRGYGTPNRPDVPQWNQWIDPALDQPNPLAVFSDRGYGTSNRPDVPQWNQWIPESLDQPNPPTIFPDRGYGTPNRPDVPQWNQWISEATYQPNPPTIFSDRGYGTPNRPDVPQWQVMWAPPIMTPQMLAIFPDRGYGTPNRPDVPQWQQWISEATFQPNPPTIFPDRGYGAPNRPDVPQWQVMWAPPVVTPQMLAIFPDRGYGTPNRPDVPQWQQWIPESLDQPNPPTIFSDRGYGTPNRPDVPQWQVQWPLPSPIITPQMLAVFPDRGYGTPFRQGHQWVLGPMFQPTPPVVHEVRTVRHFRQVQTVGDFRWNQTFGKGDLEICLTDPQGNQQGPFFIGYTLFIVYPTGVLHQVGPTNRKPAQADVGKFYVTGTAGENGQPGCWAVLWRYQRTYAEPIVEELVQFRVLDGVLDCERQEPSHIRRHCKFGWDL
jgi:hypothetical protein